MPSPTTKTKQVTSRASVPGGPPRLSLILYGRDGVKVVALDRGQPAVVGRAHPADVVVDDPSLSRRHAELVWLDEPGPERVRIRDLGSTNGTNVRGRRVDEAFLLVGDEARLASVVVAVHAVGATSASVETHEGFRRALEEALSAAARHGAEERVTGVLALTSRGSSTSDADARRLVTFASHEVADETVGYYGGGVALVLLRGTDDDVVIGRADALTRSLSVHDAETRAGLALAPSHARWAEEVLARSRQALARATEPGLHLFHEDEDPRTTGPDDDTRSPAMRATMELVRRVARATLPVLIHGETGSGKELVARAVHASSPRASAPFRAINCAALPPTLLESSLFGHERGAFTGADRQHRGLFEQASGGTVFLDELGELTPPAQAALLRVLETKRIMRVGGTQEVEVDVRIVAATHRDLETMSKEEKFRWDLYYRLAAAVVNVPPLRERAEDIEPLAHRFLADATEGMPAAPRRFESAALDAMRAYEWPGNVRELKNAVERAVVVATTDRVELADLPERVRGAARPSASTGPSSSSSSSRLPRVSEAPSPLPAPEPTLDAPVDGDFRARIEAYERNLILDALSKTGGNQSEAAKLLRMPRRTLVHKIRQYGIAKTYE